MTDSILSSIITNGVDTCCNKYENILFMVDFNVEDKEENFCWSCSQYKLKLQSKYPTNKKNFDNPSCGDLLLANTLKMFESPCSVERGFSDFHKLVATGDKRKT